MCRKNKILISIFVFGLFLCSLGAGILFAEISAFNYNGDYIYKTKTPKTNLFLISTSTFEGPVNIIFNMPENKRLLGEVVVDDTLEEGIIQVETTYDPDFVSPFVQLDSVSSDFPDEYTSVLRVNYYYIYDSFSMMLKFKNVFLDDFKNSTFRNYQFDKVFNIEISAAPMTASRLKI